MNLRLVFRTISLASLLLFSSILAAETVATVGNESISDKTFQTAAKSLGPQGEMVMMNPDLRKKFLDHMINSRLIAQEAKNQKFGESDAMKERFEEIKNQLLANEFMENYLKTKMTDAELQKYFDANKAQFSSLEIRASHILVDDEKKAKEILAEVQKTPAKFEELAKKNSKDKTVDLGFFKHGAMVPEFEAAAFATGKGKINANVVKTSFGYHIIKVTDTKGGDNAKFADVKKDVESRYRTQLQKQLVDDLRAKTKISVNEEALKKVAK